LYQIALNYANISPFAAFVRIIFSGLADNE